MLKTYKYRLYPNREQEILIRKTFGCCRFVYNQTLAYRKEKYKTTGRDMSKYECGNYVIHVLKKEFPWLSDVDKFALSNSVYDMNLAYCEFFRGHRGYPKFKSKKNHKQSYKTNITNKNIEVNFENNRIKLPKLKWVKIKAHRKFDGQIKAATIFLTPSGKYFVSVLVDSEDTPMDDVGGVVGVDLGIKDLLITSNGEKFDNLHITKKYENKLAKEQRKLSRKVKDSKNWEKQRIKVAKVHEKMYNIRTDYLNKISHKLIRENQLIVSENLSVKDMVRNHGFSKAILDCGWYELTLQLQYKAEWNHRQYIKIDRYVKSSQMCSVCGYINPNTKDVNVREWGCPNCGTIHDRDVNAANNILFEGLKMLYGK